MHARDLSFDEWCQKISECFIASEATSPEMVRFRNEKDERIYLSFLLFQQKRISNYLLLHVFPEDHDMTVLMLAFTGDPAFERLAHDPLVVPPEAVGKPIAFVYATASRVWDYFAAWFMRGKLSN